MTTCGIRLLGDFGAEVDGRAVPERAWRHRRATELVKILALAEGHRSHREQVTDLLWPDLPADAASANLRKAVHFARRALGSEEAIGTTSGMVSLWPDGRVLVDADQFAEAADAALRAGNPVACEAAAARYTGELLPADRYATWAHDARERLRLRFVEVLKGAHLWERALEVDPVDEEAHRALMQRALDAGDRQRAVRQFERLRSRLRADLGLGPDRASVALYEEALAMEGDQPPTAAERVRSMLAWGLVHLNTGDIAEAERAATGARALAIDSHLGQELGQASALRGLVANQQGQWKQLFRSEFVDAVRQSPRIAAFVFDAHLCLAEFCLCGPAGHGEIVGYARDLGDVARQAGSAQGRGLAELLLGEAALFSGDLDDAEAHLGAARGFHERAGAHSGEALATQRLAEVALARGQRQQARRLLRRGLRLAEAHPLAPHLVVRMHGALVECASSIPEGVHVVEHADEALHGVDVCPPCSMGFRVAATTTLARAGRITRAGTRLEEAERLAGMWRGGPWQAATWEARAVLRDAQGDRDQAAALYREAAARFAELGRPVEAARCAEAAAS